MKLETGATPVLRGWVAPVSGNDADNFADYGFAPNTSRTASRYFIPFTVSGSR